MVTFVLSIFNHNKKKKVHHTYKEGGSLLPRAWETFVEEVTYSQAWMHGWDSGGWRLGGGTRVRRGQPDASECHVVWPLKLRNMEP